MQRRAPPITRQNQAATPARRTSRGFLAVAIAVAAVAIGAWTWSRYYLLEASPPLTADRAEMIARRIGVVFADTEGVWRRTLRTEAGRTYTPAELVLFTREMPSPCAGAAFATGPFYCRIERTAGFDMAYFDNLNARLRRQAELGAALTVARVVAAHVQRELGVLDAATAARRGAGADDALELALLLQADCLTGVWAAAAAGGLGLVPAGFYAELIRIARNVVRDRAREGLVGPPEADVFFTAGTPAEHEQAFVAGYAGAKLASCPPPALPLR